MKHNLILSLSVLLLMAATVHARQTDSLNLNQQRLYLGVAAGMPMAEADFSSFGANGFRPGWNLGINAGYRFSKVWSLEMTANWGQLFLAEQNCCISHNYFLGSDLNRYHPSVIPDGLDGRYHKDIKSRTFTQRYGLQVNMNILGFFARTKTGPWRFEIAPAVYAVGTSSDIITKQDKIPFVENIGKWHLGYGGQAQVSYAIANNMNIGLYGGYTQLTGRQMDGMPGLHSTNYIIDAGIKFSIGLKMSRRPARHTAAAVPTAQPAQDVQQEKTLQPEQVEEKTAVVQPEEVVHPEEKMAVEEQAPAVQQEPAEEKTTVVQPEEKVAEQPEVREESPFPVIYFSFNSIWIEPSERGKVKEIADMMKADKSIRVRIVGWCDPAGGEETNKRVSLMRAEAVKRVLGQWLIPAERIETVGGGIMKDAASDAEARNATTFEIL